MTLDEIKADIIGACEEFKAAGKKLLSGHWNEVAEDGSICGGCALTAVHLMRCESAANTRIAIEKRYGWTYERVWHFIAGFDGADFGSTAFVSDDRREAEIDEDVYELGRELRNVVIG